MLVIAVADAVVRDAHGVPISLRQGEAWDASDPLVKLHPKMFSSDEGGARRTVEQATAAPGEKRNVRRG